MELGRQVARCGIDRLYLLGARSARVRQGARLAGMNGARVIVGRSHRQIARLLSKQVRAGDWVLFKGSRGMRIEAVLAAWKEMGA
jgi:UDP-N-acetylmuramoyl-tripeptide--D-alanyl-D-alanine ligase